MNSKDTRALLAQCLEAATASTASKSLVASRPRAPRAWERGRVDAAVHIRVDGHRADFVVVVRSSLTEDPMPGLRLLRDAVAGHGAQLLVCTRRARRAVVERLRDAGISLLDSTGTVSLQAKGVRIYCLGRAPAAPPGLRRATGTDTRILHALLRRGTTATCTHRELAAAAGVSLGAVGSTLRALEARGLLRRRAKDDWRVVDAAAAQARFLEGWATIVRSKLAPQRFRAAQPGFRDTVPKQLVGLGADVLLGGEIAAVRLGAALVSEFTTLHVPADQRGDVVRRMLLVPDATGPITLLDRFGAGDAFPDPHLPGLHLAHPLLVHAELAVQGEERLQEAMAVVWRAWVDTQGRTP